MGIIEIKNAKLYNEIERFILKEEPLSPESLEHLQRLQDDEMTKPEEERDTTIGELLGRPKQLREDG